MRSLMLGLVTIAALSAPARSDALREMAAQMFGPLPPVEGVSPELAELGRSLFFDVRLSAGGDRSCASCHDPSRGGADGLEVALGHDWQVAPRNTATVLNAVLNDTPSWDMLDGLASPSESGLRSLGTPEVLDALRGAPDLAEGLAAAFPDQGDPVSLATLAEALDAYLETLLTPAPFDAWLKGDDAALSDAAKAGLQHFIDHGCAFCHYGLNLGGSGYYPFGLVEVSGAGAAVLSDTSDAGLDFRAAPLRNVARTAPYFHSGKIADLGVAVAVMAESQLGSPLGEEETAAIVAFLESLSGEVAP